MQNRPLAPSLALAAALLAAAPSALTQDTGGSGGGMIAPHGSNCVTAADLARVDPLPDLGGPSPAMPAPFFRIYPMGSRVNVDCGVAFYNDLQAGAGILDYECGALTYDFHQGNDATLQGFEEQLIGVPVFAALDGTVADVHDGEPDMNTVNNPGAQANYVIINHAGGGDTWYWHLRKNSVSVSVGQKVKAGQQIGEVGSSGNSSWPHLHFQTNTPSAIEPFSGSCNAGTSFWFSQPTYTSNATTSITDFGISETAVSGPAPQFPWNRDPHWSQTSASLWLWVEFRNLTVGNDFQYKIYRPNGSLALSTPVLTLTGPFQTIGRRWWNNLPSGITTTTGTWKVEYYFNGVLQFTAPFEVVPTPIPGYNQAPYAVSAKMEPECPGVEDIPMVLIEPNVVDDPNYDLLSYRYEWKVNGTTVRDYVSAGLADAVPWDAAGLGDTLSCTITPNDGSLDGPSTTVSVVIGQGNFVNYCTAGSSASGCQATLSGSGLPSATAVSGFDLIASGVEGAKDGLFFFGTNGRQANSWGSGTSFQCVVPPVVRGGLLTGVGTAGLCDGAFAQDLNALWCSSCPKPLKNPGAGAVVDAQLWYRDPFNTANQTTSLSDAIEFVVCP